MKDIVFGEQETPFGTTKDYGLRVVADEGRPQQYRASLKLTAVRVALLLALPGFVFYKLFGVYF